MNMQNKKMKKIALVLLLGLTMGCMGCGKGTASNHGVDDSYTENQQDPENGNAVEDDSDSMQDTEMEADTEPEEADIPEEVDEDLWVSQTLAEMTLEEKVCQMFMVTPETLTGYTTVTAAGSVTQQAMEQYPVGGMIYFSGNLLDEDQTRTMLQNTAAYARENHDIPIFLSVDEEGGRVARIGNNSGFSVEKVPPMREIGDSGDLAQAYGAGNTLGTYLSDLGFNLDYAPDADVVTNSSNTVIGDRSFGTDADCVSDMMLEVAAGLSDNGVIPCVKHFPGHGCTEGDTHQGLAYTNKTLEELESCELVPFQTAVDNDLPMIMVSHISVPSIVGDDTPSSLSHYMVTEVLREKMGYDGIVITDGMGMGAIADNYESGEAAVLAVQAGCDMLLVTNDFVVAYEAVLAAVSDGRIPESQIDASVERILRVKWSVR
ncbi:MAG: glycoside hydrolase family 3 protein [Lachnospiraceae bacterium]|nr:glycoside hydrolase family 3 protein [Lachnospiraceae bacterium]